MKSNKREKQMKDTDMKKYCSALNFYVDVLGYDLPDPNDGMVEHPDKLIYCYEHNKDMLDYDCWIYYEELLNERLTFNEYSMLDSRIPNMILEYSVDQDILLVNDLRKRLALHRNSVEIEILNEENYFDRDLEVTDYWYRYQLRDHNNQIISEGIYSLSNQEHDYQSFESLKPKVKEDIKKNYEILLTKPYLCETSKLFQKLIQESLLSESGMVFIDDSLTYFNRDLLEYELEELQNEVDRLHMEGYIEILDFETAKETGLPLITVHTGISTEFELFIPVYREPSIKQKEKYLEIDL